MPIKNAVFRIQFSICYLIAFVIFQFFICSKLIANHFALPNAFVFCVSFFIFFWITFEKKIRLQQSLITVRMEDSCKTEEQVGHGWWEYSRFVPPFCSCSKKNFFSANGGYCVFTKNGSVLDPSAKYKHVISTHFPSPKNIPRVHIWFSSASVHWWKPSQHAATQLQNPHISVFESSFHKSLASSGYKLVSSRKGLLGDPDKRSFNVRGKVKLFLLRGGFHSCNFFYFVPKLFYFLFLHLRISLFLPTLHSPNY